MARDREMTFSSHSSKVDKVLDEPGKTHKAGVRYPAASSFTCEGTSSPFYQEHVRICREEGEP